MEPFAELDRCDNRKEVKSVKMRVSIRQIAEVVGCSTATVSLSLRGDTRIAQTTREAIRDAAQRLGYKRDPVLSSLAAKRFRPGESFKGAGVVVLTDGLSTGSVRYKHDLLQAISEFGYRPEEYVAVPGAKLDALQRRWYATGIRGVILDNTPIQKVIAGHGWDHFAVVLVGGRYAAPAFHTVKTHVARSVIQAFEKAVERGFRRIGFALLRHEDPVFDDQLRRAMALDCLNRLPQRDRIPIWEGTFQKYPRIGPWIRKHRPDAVIGFNPFIIWMFEKDGFAAPRDFAYINLSLRQTETTQTGVVENGAEVARCAVRLVDELARVGETGNPEVPSTLNIPGRWQEGNTLP